MGDRQDTLQAEGSRKQERADQVRPYKSSLMPEHTLDSLNIIRGRDILFARTIS